MLFHKNCNSKVLLDLSASYVLRSPTISITTKGISPGMVEIDGSDNKTGAVLYCPKCKVSFSSKEEFEENLIANCVVCQHTHPPSELFVTDYISIICNNCMKGDTKELNSREIQYLSLYGDYIKKQTNPSLLTIIMKK